MTPETNQTVREIAIQNPATVRVFETLGIDYCCGGKRPLSEACERAAVPLDKALQMLAALESESMSPEEKSWSTQPLRALIAHIVTRHHAFIRSEAPRLTALVAKVVSRHGPAHPELLTIQETFGALVEELLAHLMKEEQILFPFIENMEAASAVPSNCFGSVEFPIARMLADHDDAGALTAQIRSLSSNFQPPEGACPSYSGLYQGLADFERDLHQHIHLENNILFPRAVELEKQLAVAVQVGCV
ncbi:MAG: iron-sulfur cluster repair di-iron protein [Acidobacteriia bacterium]|nr:iron-sulfur cluster repair di-iron protein [Terriglobia bacterium]